MQHERRNQPVATDFNLSSYPNPFNPSTTISCELSVNSNVTLKAYHVLGKEVRTLLNNENETAGSHAIHWDGTKKRGHRVGSGVYFYQLTAQNGEETKKAVYIQ